MKITVVGGTGYAGAHIAREALDRGIAVRIVARKYPEEPLPGAEYLLGSVTDQATIDSAVKDTDAVVVALSPRGNMAGKVQPTIQNITKAADAAGVRVGVVIGAGSLLEGPMGPQLYESPEFPDVFKNEAIEMGAVLDDLLSTPESVNWFAISPAAGFGAHTPGVRTGKFRLGDDIVLRDADGNSNLSGEDLAVAVIDELEHPAHQRRRFTAAY